MTATHNSVDVELGDSLQEFEDVVMELSSPHTYEDALRLSEAEDSDYCSEASLVSSLSVSEEELDVVCVRAAKLGDTSDLQRFIENLDRELADM